MNVEPEVIRSIKHHRRMNWLQRRLYVIPLAIGLAISCSLVLFNYLRSVDPSSTPGYPLTPEKEIFIIIVPGAIAVLACFHMILMPALRQFKSVTREADVYDHFAFKRFRVALENVCIGAGVKAPPLVVLELPSANTISFQKRGRVCVGVSKEALEADIPAHEIEAMMAHELSHIMAYGELRSANLFLGLGGALFIFLVFVIPFIYAYVKPVTYSSYARVYMLITLPLVVLVSAPISMYLMKRPYSISRLSPARNHEDILADSVAIKLTSNPDAMRSAIERTAVLMDVVEEMPNDTIAFTRLFMGPIKEWPPDIKKHLPGLWVALQELLDLSFLSYFDRASNTNRFADDVAYSYFVDGRKQQAYLEIMRQTRRFVEWQRNLIRARQYNIELIKHEQWQAF